MHMYAREAGITDFILQSEILDSLGVSELIPEMTHDKAPHPVDGLQGKYNKKILDLFTQKALAL